MRWNNLKEQSEEYSFEKDRGLTFIAVPFLFVVLIWMVYWIDYRYFLDLYELGIKPRTYSGLQGIVFSPLLHGGISHLLANSWPLLILGGALYYFYPKVASWIVLWSWLFGGILTWLIAHEGYHIGASGLIYSLAGFVFLSGILRWQVNLLALSFLVAFLYGGMLWGILPYDEKISWEGHLSGGIVGFVLAFFYRKLGPARKKYSWDFEKENETEDEIDLIGDQWKQYSGEHAAEPTVTYYYKPNQGSEGIPKEENLNDDRS